MRRIFAIATDSAGCFLYRLHWPLTHLNPDEFDVVWRGPEIYRRIAGDVVVGQRIAGDNQAWLDLCEDPTILAVYEIDDDIVDVDPANEIPYSIFQPQRDGTIRNIAAADVVTCSTPYLAAKIRRWNDNVVVLPNCLPREWFDAPDRRRHDGSITVGWAGSPFHSQDWPGFRIRLAEFASQTPRARFATIGADYMSPHVPVASSVGWTIMDRYLAALDFDIGLAPLSHTDFNRSKSHAKLLEYGARGIPAVASCWGQYEEWGWQGEHEEPEAAYLFDRQSDAQIVELLTLLCDDDVRARMGAAARKRAEQYEISRQVHRWADVYRQQPRGA